jgi:transcriptional regulator with XRE-family HTH domain
MPRRKVPDPIALAIGTRIRQLRLERGVTAESMVFEGEVRSKGFLSDIEKGLALPSLITLTQVADSLHVALVDLVTFPEKDERHALIDRTRSLSRGVLRKLLRELSAAGPHTVASKVIASRATPVLVVRDSQRIKPRRPPKPSSKKPKK